MARGVAALPDAPDSPRAAVAAATLSVGERALAALIWSAMGGRSTPVVGRSTRTGVRLTEIAVAERRIAHAT
ncbi:MAG: hypothetical protein ACRDZ4_05480 [Egibacteraceae bacterium]